MSNFPIKGNHKGFWRQQQQDRDTDDMQIEPVQQQFAFEQPPAPQRERRQKREQPDRQAKSKKPAIAIPRVNASTMELETEEKAEERVASWVPKRKSMSELSGVNLYSEEQLDQLADEIRKEWDDKGPNAKTQGNSCVIV